jgi:hypothetical protein
MTKNKFLKNALLLFLLIPTVVFAQKNVLTVSGNVLDGEDHLPMPYASVQLFSLPDSVYLRGVVGDIDGNFAISSDVTPGNYFLRISYVGFEATDKNFTVKNSEENVNIGRVTLNVSTILLEEAVVVAVVAPIIVREDTTIFNAASFRVAEGAMLEELVKKLPGAEISQDGKITVNGKEIKKIMVDGKEFFTDDPQIAMKNLPANMVEKVKAYDRKSDNARLTGIEDDEDETVLDLSVKKGMKQGWFGNVLAGAGSKMDFDAEDKLRYEAGGMINRFQENSNLSVIASTNNTNNRGFSEFGNSGFGVRGNAGAGITSSSIIGTTFAQNLDKVQLGGSVQYGYSDNDAKMRRATETFLQNGSSYRADADTSRRKRDDVSANFRLEWKPDSMTTITFRPNISYSNTQSVSTGSSRTENSLRQPVNYKLSNNSMEGDNVLANGNLQYFRKLSKPGRNFSLSARMDYSYNQSDNYSKSNTHFYFYNEVEDIDSLLSLNRYTDKNNNSLTYRLQGTYTEPLFKGHYLQFKYAFQQRNSTGSSYVYTDDVLEYYVDSLSNKVKNQYNTHQIEATLQGQYAKLNYNAGFSLDPQSSQSETTVGYNSGKDLRQHVLNFSPTLRLRYRISKQEMLMLRYRGQSSAPYIEYLQEIIDISDPLNLQFGNPDLKPSYRNMVTLRYSNFVSGSQRSYALNGNFTNTLNAVTRKLSYNTETGGKRSDMVNVDGNWNATASFTFSSPLRNRKFSVASATNAGYSDEVSFANEGSGNHFGEAARNVTHTLGLREKLTGSFRTDLLDASLNASVNYMLAQNSFRTNSNRETFDYEFGGNTNVNLPYNMFFSTDITYRIYTGYSEGFDNNNLIWNAQLSKNLLKNNAATVRLKIYDILRQQSSLTRTVTETAMSDTEYNTLGSYFMVHFVYRINTLGKSNSSSGQQQGGDGGYERSPQRQNPGGRGGGRPF